jgi:hypothetical protein
VEGWLWSLFKGLLTALSERSGSILGPLITILIMAWRYRALILNRLYRRGYISVIQDKTDIV